MPDAIYDTRYFICIYTAKEPNLKRKLESELKTRRSRYVSALTIYGVYRLSLQTEGHEVAKMRKTTIERDFEVIPVTSEIAVKAAEIKIAHESDLPLADAIIGATAILHKLGCFTDDNHLKQLIEMKTRWI